MRVVRSAEELARLLQTSPSAPGEMRGFVPTMGALHRGHFELLKRARAENETVAASIYVNPTQFNQADDFVHYPRTEDDDLRLCAEAGVDWVYLPKDADLYPDQYKYRLTETSDSTVLEGEFRPGHFNGVLTVVLRLFLQVRPHRAYFGEKDYQQLHLIQGLAAAFPIGTTIVPCPTVRESDGLAMSSRNRRLSSSARIQAVQLVRALRESSSCEAATERLTKAGFQVEYVAERWGRRLAAASLEGVRLIDNIPLTEVQAPLDQRRTDP